MTVRYQHGFTFNELLIALVLLGIVAAFSIPKLMRKHQEYRMETGVQNVFVSVGQGYLLRKALTDTNEYGPEDIGTSERTNFRDFLDDHLNYSKKNSAGDPATYIATGLYAMPHNVRITQIQDINTTTPYTLEVRMAVEKPDGTDLDFTMVILDGTDRYTTKYGFTGNSVDCNEADEILNVVAACP